MYAIRTEGRFITKQEAHDCGCFDPPKEIQEKMKTEDWYGTFKVGCFSMARSLAPFIVEYGKEFEIVKL